MHNTVTIFCKNTNLYHEIPLGASLLDIYKSLNIKLKFPVVAARVNYKVEDLNFLIYKPKDIDFIDSSTQSGMRVYVRTLSMVIAKAVEDTLPGVVLNIEHPISKGYYCKLEGLGSPVNQVVIDKIKERVAQIVAAKIKIHCEEKQTKVVTEMFREQAKRPDVVSLLETFGNPYCRYFRIDNYIDYFTGVLLPSTEHIDLYDLVPYYDGMLLRIPGRDNPTELEVLEVQPKMFEIFKEYVGWNRIMNLNNVGEFNQACRINRSFNLIKVSEALHEKKVAAGDTAVFSTSAIYGSFFNSGYDTLYITRIQVGLQGTSPSVAVKVWYNDSLNVTAGGTALVTAGNTCTDIYTGTSITTFDNYKIPPGVWVWVATPTVTIKPTYFTLTLIGYKKRV